eukprot:1030274-Amorphochlora_amoeboformis.AAC.1
MSMARSSLGALLTLFLAFLGHRDPLVFPWQMVAFFYVVANLSVTLILLYVRREKRLKNREREKGELYRVREREIGEIFGVTDDNVLIPFLIPFFYSWLFLDVLRGVLEERRGQGRERDLVRARFSESVIVVKS